MSNGRGKRVVRVGLAVLLLAALGVAPTDGRPGPAHPSRRISAGEQVPNLLLIVADDFRGGILGVDGDPRKATPRLDRLASQGVRFTRAYCNSPLCTASRASFITGKLPHNVGVTRLLSAMPLDAVTLGGWLSDLGYNTAAYGKMHFNSGSRHGFGELLDTDDWKRHLKAHPPEEGDRRRKWRPFQDPPEAWLNAEVRPAGLPESAMESRFYSDRAAEFFKANRSRPFGLVVSFYDPHAPFQFPDAWPATFRPDQFPDPRLTEADKAEQPAIFRRLSPEQFRGVAASYYSSVSFVDAQIGRVLDALDAEGLSDETIVVFLGDNGYMLGEHGRLEKHCSYEPSVLVPLLVRWPGHVPAGRVVPDLVELIDVMPTMLDLAGLPLPPGLDGQSLAGLALGTPGARGREVAYSEYTENEEAMARDDRYKLVVSTGRRRRLDGYATGGPLPGPSTRLYDTRDDPGETRDLAADPGLARVRDALLDAMRSRAVSGPGRRVPPPPGLAGIDALHWSLVPQD